MMNSFSKSRVRQLNQVQLNPNGDYVIYWMQIFRRTQFNFALEYAVELANELGKPLLVYEGLSASYPYASARFHSYILDGMLENLNESEKKDWNYLPFIEPSPKAGNGLIYHLAKNACAIVTDDYPVFIINKHNQKVSTKVAIPYFVVDSNGLIPFSKTDKAPFSAYLFRKIMQKHFVEAIQSMPKESPLNDLQNRERIRLTDEFYSTYQSVSLKESKSKIIEIVGVDQTVKPIAEVGTRKNALFQYEKFLNQKLTMYHSDRNHPDKNGASFMSGFLHFGKISEHEMVKKALELQPKSWSIEQIVYENGQSGSFFKGDEGIESFLDELITWREVGHHFAFHNPDYELYDSLPNWALETLQEHEKDGRPYLYSFEELNQSKTHDPIWNAAQRELVADGRIHNYLRMLWGKKILEWTPNPRTALEYMIELNNRYAIDGRDPNSYSGIFWVLGRFDRAWGERPVFGKIRYMSSDSTIKKIDLKNYLKKWSGLK